MRSWSMPILIGIIIISFIATGCDREMRSVTESRPTTKPKSVDVQKIVPQKAPKVAKPVEAPTPVKKPITEERILFSFEEDDLGGWEIPYWALEKDDHVAKSIEISKDFASERDSSLKVNSDFPGGRWTASLIELERYMDFSPYDQIAVDIYIPESAPLGLRAKMIITVGENWKFTEMTRGIPLISGEWVSIKADISPGSYDWKRTVPDEAFRTDVRKIVIRIESNRRPVYKGPVYIDNLRIGK